MTTEVVVPKTEEQLQADAIAVAEKSRTDTLAAGEETPVDAIVDTIPARPEGVPEKFYDAKTGQVDMTAWGKAHTDLETQFHADKATADADAAKTPEVIAAEKVIADAAAADTTPVSAAQAEYAKDGKLSDDTYANLAKSGMDRTTVDAYIAGRQTQADAISAPAFEAAGGEEKYTEMTTWAETNLSEVEISAYNAQVNSGDPAVVKLAAEGLAKRFAENATVDGERLDGGSPAVTGGVFESKAEMTAAMGKMSETVKGKTQYAVDPAYRQAVQRKIQASRKAGKNIFI